jgi:hypothetical protein
MAKSPTWFSDPKSLRDAAYMAARSIEGVESAAVYVRTQCPTFADEQPAEVLGELDAGWLQRYSELHPTKTYFLTNDGRNWVLPSDGVIPDGVAKREVGVVLAMSYSPQAVGALKNEDPVFYQILLPLRTEYQKYRSNRKGDLIRQIRKLERAESGEVLRKPTKAFADYVSDLLGDMVVRCKNAKARGDDTADLDLLNRQIAAFKSVK